MSTLIFLALVALAYFVYKKRDIIKSFILLSPAEKNHSIPPGKNFQFAIYDDRSDIKPGVWYRLNDWKYPPNYLRMEDKEKGRLGIDSPYEEIVKGTEFEDRWKNFVLLGDQPDFRLYLEREPRNKFDKNAIKVMCSASVNGNTVIKHLGYVSKETAANLKGIDPIEIGSASVSLPIEGRVFVLNILIV
jgi:hypothetical protein